MNRVKNFYSFVSNGEYSVGCTGQTVYIFDENGTELASFKDLTYAYDCAISPKGDAFVVRTTEGRIAVYSLSELCLVKKFRFSDVAEAQDDNLFFSSDGEMLYNIERHIDSCKTALSVYDTKDFSLIKRLFSDNHDMMLTCGEYDSATETVYLTGFFRKKRSRVAFNFFAARLENEELSDIRYISKAEHDYCVSYKKLEMSGFTEKGKRLSDFNGREEDLIKAQQEELSISRLWNKKGESK